MSDEDPSRFIDVESLPFTEAEIRRAFLLGGVPDADAARVAADIAALPEQTAQMAREAAAARARGSTVPEEINPPSWYVGHEIYAILWCVPGLAARADAFMERRFRECAAELAEEEMKARGLPAEGAVPSEVVTLVRRRLAPHRAAWTRRKRRLAGRMAEDEAKRST